MAGMDLSLRRADRGISVFWLILAMGAGVFALLAILLLATGNAVDEVEYGGGPVIIEADGETTYNATPSTAAAAAGDREGETDAAEFSAGEVADDGPTPQGDNPTTAVEVETEAGVPSELDAEAGATVIDEDAIDEEPGERTAPGENEIVVDPDGTTAPVVPTDSGPEGSDGNPLTND